MFKVEEEVMVVLLFLEKIMDHVDLLSTYYFIAVPEGGNGGDGGDVYFKATSRILSLHDLRRAHFRGNHGKSGRVKYSISKDLHLGCKAGWIIRK